MVAETQVKEELSKLLKTVDFSATSERQIRQQLCEKLGEDVLQLKDLIKREVNAYLDAAAGTTKRKADTPTPSPKAKKLARTDSTPAELDSIPAVQDAKKGFPRDGLDLGGKKRADVSTFKGQVYVSVREWYEKDGQLKPGAKGISLHAQDQFSKIQENAGEITAALEEQNEAYELILTDKRKVNISKFTGKATVNIREYYEKDGKQLPGKKGIMLSADLWTKLRSAFPALSQEAGRLSST